MADEKLPEGLEAKWEEIMNPPGAETATATLPAETDLVKETKEQIQGVPEKAPEPVGKEGEFVDIPDDQTEAGRAYGLTDEQIVHLAEDTPAALEAMANLHKRIKESARVAGAPVVEKPAAEPPPERLDYDALGDLTFTDEATQKAVKSVVDSHNKLVDRLTSIETKVGSFDQRVKVGEGQRAAEFDATVDGFFDNAGIPQLGKTGTLTASQESARLECYEFARSSFKSSGGKLDVALNKAVKAYKGMYDIGEKPEDILRKKLDKNKERFTARPGGQKTTPQLTEDERAQQALKEKAVEIGAKW